MSVLPFAYVCMRTAFQSSLLAGVTLDEERMSVNLNRQRAVVELNSEVCSNHYYVTAMHTSGKQDATSSQGDSAAHYVNVNA